VELMIALASGVAEATPAPAPNVSARPAAATTIIVLDSMGFTLTPVAAKRVSMT
jgi:hypothetical protein